MPMDNMETSAAVLLLLTAAHNWVGSVSHQLEPDKANRVSRMYLQSYGPQEIMGQYSEEDMANLFRFTPEQIMMIVQGMRFPEVRIMYNCP